MTPSEREIHAGFKDSYVSLTHPPLERALPVPFSSMAQRPHVRPRESPLTAPLNKQDWVRYLVEERAAKQQKTLLSPATEPARPCNGRFQVYTESVQSGLHAKMRMAENTIMPLLRENFCLEQA